MKYIFCRKICDEKIFCFQISISRRHHSGQKKILSQNLELWASHQWAPRLWWPLWWWWYFGLCDENIFHRIFCDEINFLSPNFNIFAPPQWEPWCQDIGIWRRTFFYRKSAMKIFFVVKSTKKIFFVSKFVTKNILISYFSHEIIFRRKFVRPN